MNVEQFNEKLDNINEAVDKFDKVSSDVLDKVVVDPSIWVLKWFLKIAIPSILIGVPVGQIVGII